MAESNENGPLLLQPERNNSIPKTAMAKQLPAENPKSSILEMLPCKRTEFAVIDA